MKQFLFICLLIFSSAESFNAASLTIYLSKCRSECDTETGKVKIYKGRKLLKKSKTFKTELLQLDAGTYFVEYNTLAEKRRTLEVVVADKEDKVLTLCFDDFEYDKKVAPSAMDVLKDQEKITIQRSYRRKGTSGIDSLILYRNGTEYFLEYHDEKRKLNEVEKEIIREFEYFLLYFSRKGHCRQKDKYSFTYGNTVIKRKDKTCGWNGFHYLLIDLKLRDPDPC